MAPERLYELINRYLQETILDQERQELKDALNDPEMLALAEDLIDRQLSEGVFTYQADLTDLQLRISEIVAAKRSRVITFNRVRWVAAAVLLFAIAGTWYLLQKKGTDNAENIAAIMDVAPGHSGAVLHLSDGRTITLDSAANGKIATQGTMQVIKENGALKYIGNTDQVVYNDVTTDKGRQWQLTLPDGTKVWLNASSSIHYPIAFTEKERVVEITGEVFFDVVHNAKQPFRVIAGNTNIEDIGTGFNVNAYSDEGAVKTTLVEGVVRVSQNSSGGAGAQFVTLKPGEQFVNGDIARVNTDEVTAWKNGFFAVNNADIQTVMRQLARWYDVTVSYEGSVPNQRFTGKIDHNLTLTQVLNGLSDSKVHYRIEEKNGSKHIVIIP